MICTSCLTYVTAKYGEGVIAHALSNLTALKDTQKSMKIEKTNFPQELNTIVFLLQNFNSNKSAIYLHKKQL